MEDDILPYTVPFVLHQVFIKVFVRTDFRGLRGRAGKLCFFLGAVLKLGQAQRITEELV